jgi:hypothetical protein
MFLLMYSGGLAVRNHIPQTADRNICDFEQVLEENLDWEDVQWSQTGVWIDGKEFTLARVRFLSPS